VLLAWYRPTLGVLRAMPSASSMNLAMVLYCAAFASYALALTLHRARPESRRPSTLPLEPGNGVAFAFVGLGLAGTLLKFRSIGALIQYFTLRGGGLVTTYGSDATMIQLFGTLARPFGTYGFLILLWRALRDGPSTSRTIRVAAYGLGAFAAVASFDYNRASIVMPLLAFVATYSRFVRRIPARRLAAGFVVLLLASIAFGNARRIEIGTQGGRFSREDALLTGPAAPFYDNIEVYGSAPQFTAIVVDRVDDGAPITYGRSIVASALSPVPLLGKSFRDSSGNTAYNELIYGPNGPRDQVVPFHAELYWNFGAAGVVVGFFALGLAIAALDRRWRATITAIDGYIVLYLSIWTAFLVVGQVLSYAQVCVYFGWPIVVLAVLRSLQRAAPVNPKAARVPERASMRSLPGGTRS
jgi:hypothetical protein